MCAFLIFQVCGKPGCFECFDIYCERCESKDRRIIELEMRNNDLAKYITQLQAKIFGPSKHGLPSQTPQFQQPINFQQVQQATDGRPAAPAGAATGYGQPGGKGGYSNVPLEKKSMLAVKAACALIQYI